MSVNVYNGDAEHLLEWVNLERFGIGHSRSLQGWAQVLDSGVLYRILALADGCVFDGLNNLQPNKIVNAIEKYLQKQCGKRIKWSFKHKLSTLTTQPSIKQFTKLTCYITIHSKSKQPFISRILTLPEHSQTSLMQELKQFQHNLQNITQLKQIIQYLEQLQEENYMFNAKITEMNAVNREMLELLSMEQCQGKRYREEVEGMRGEKMRMWEELGLRGVKDYVEAYREVRDQCKKLECLLAEEDRKRQELENKLQDCKIKSQNDQTLIQTLQDNIARLKHIIRSGYPDYPQQYLQNSKRALQPLSQNKPPSISSSLQKSQQSTCISSLHSLSQISQLEQNMSLRMLNRQLNKKLQEMYKNYNNLNTQVQEVKRLNVKLEKNNGFLKKLVKQIEEEYMGFWGKYKDGLQEDKRKIIGDVF